MENLEKDYNFFYIKEHEKITTVIITSSLGNGKYTKEDISNIIDKLNNIPKISNLISLFEDDGENFWSIFDNKKLDIGSKEDNYKKWEDIKTKIEIFEIEDFLVLSKYVKKENSLNRNKIK